MLNRHFIRYGYFDHPSQTEPEFDPGLDIDCPVCHRPLRDEPIQTISIMLAKLDIDEANQSVAILGKDTRSHFYRIHKDCNTDENAEWIEDRLNDQRMIELGQMTLDEFNEKYD